MHSSEISPTQSINEISIKQQFIDPPQRKSALNTINRTSLMQSRNSINQNQRMSSMNFQDPFFELYQRKQMQSHIKDSINNLKGVISKNVALRKGDTSGKGSTLSNTKFFSNLTIIKNHYQQKIENKDLLSSDTNNKLQTKGYQINKSLRNLSIITQKTDINNENQGLQFIKNGIKDEFSAYKPLYKRYFSENANNFIKSIQDPYDPKLRNKILKNDNEYDKFLQSYLNKVKLVQQKQNLQKKSATLTKNHSTQNLFTFEGRDLLTLNKQQNDIEKNFITQIGDLDNFQEKHMIETLDKLQSGQMAYPQKRKVETQKTRMVRVIQIENEKRKIQTAASFYRTHTTGGFAGSTQGNGFGDKQSQNEQNSNQQSQQQQFQQQQLQQQQPQLQQQQQQQQHHYFNNTYLNTQKLQKKLENQTKKGYHVIKRNQSEHALAYNQDELVRDESDDSSNASRTEATLDVLYSESIQIQNRLVSDNQDGLIRKLKQLIKLENLKKNVLQANLYKLEHR